MSRGIESIILGGLLGEALKDATKRPDQPKRPVAQDIAALRAVAERYSAPNPFKPGDLVTPREDSSVKGAGRPHIVLEVLEDAPCYVEPGVNGQPGASNFGQRFDMRVAETCACQHGEITACWVEGWEFEPYVEPAAASEAPSEAA